jgi:cytosine deaminase
MKNVNSIVNARLLRREGLHTVRIEGEKIARVDEQGEASSGARDGVLDAAGGLVLPALVDSHVHLDLAYSQEIVPANESGTLVEAIRLWEEAKKTITPEDTTERAVRGIRAEVRHGTGFIRSHVDVASSAGPRLYEGVLEARRRTEGLCRIELVAFPQDGLVRDPGAAENMRAALKAGVDLVGGIPHVERTREDSLRHMEIVFQLAAEFDADIDVHIDETDDPASMCVESMAALTIARGWEGRVTCSHVCALASYDDVHAAKVIGGLREAGISVVTNPGVNLHLQGRWDTYPKRRGLTRVEELLAAGVNVSVGQDCIKDPFYPMGNGNMLDQLFLLVHADHQSSPAQIERCVDMVTTGAARTLKLAEYGVRAGCRADLVVYPVGRADELIRVRPAPTAVLAGGEIPTLY